MHVAVTGASGFVAQALLRRMVLRDAWSVTGLTRQASHPAIERVNYLRLPETLGAVWPDALEPVDVFMHTAARVHVRSDAGPAHLAELQRVNVAWTHDLAREAAARGARRFVFISTIKVHGEATRPGHPFAAADAPAPQDAYAISKLEAEIGLRKIADETGMEVVIVRPPLVYGPGVKGNFAELMRWVARGIPLPLAGIDNLRSFVALDNLVDLLLCCVEHPGAANRTFLVSDGEDLSTTDLLRRLAAAMGYPSRLFPVPERWLRGVAALVDRGDAAARLCDSLQIDMTATRDALGWSPRIGVEEGLRRAARGFST